MKLKRTIAKVMAVIFLTSGIFMQNGISFAKMKSVQAETLADKQLIKQKMDKYINAQSIERNDNAIRMKKSKRFGTPEFVSGKLSNPSSEAPEKIFFNYLNKNKESFKLGKNTAEQSFKVQSKSKDSLGYTVLKIQQQYNGIPVFGTMQTAHIDKNGVLTNISGATIPDLDKKDKLKLSPKIKQENALNTAKSDLQNKILQDKEKTVQQAVYGMSGSYNIDKYVMEPSANLVVYLNGDEANYAYMVRLNYLLPQPADWRYFIDAVSGEVLFKYDSLNKDTAVSTTGVGVFGDTKSDLKAVIKSDNQYYLQDTTRGGGIFTYDANNTYNTPGTIITDPDGIFNSQRQGAGVDAHYYLGITYDYYKNVFGRNGYDNNGAEIKSSVHLGSGYDNAYWDGTQIAFGDGDGSQFTQFSGGLDVVAHEFTHAVSGSEADLIYSGESGAISESLSDSFGTFVEFYANRSPDWLCGEDIYTPGTAGDALRSMADPTVNGDPDHYSKLYGEVHADAGIMNKAIYLMANGGTHYGTTVTGIGIDNLQKILYRAMTQYLVSNSNFAHARESMVQAAIDLFGSGSQQVDTVSQAWTAVGVAEELSIGDTLLITNSQPQEYKVNIKTAANYAFKTGYNNQYCDTTMTLYDANHQQVEGGFNDDANGTLYSALQLPMPVGTYYLKVGTYNAGDTLNCSVSADVLLPPEQSMTPGTAVNISGVPEKCYKLVVQDPATYVMDTSFYLQNCDTILNVYNEKFQDVAFNDDYSGLGLYSKIEVPLSPGTYYIRVANYSWGSNVYCTLSLKEKTPPTIKLTKTPSDSTNGNVTISAQINDASGIAIKKWAAGNQQVSYFLTSGNVLTDNSFAVNSNDVYTVYAKDNSGNENVNTIVVNNILTIAAAMENVVSVSCRKYNATSGYYPPFSLALKNDGTVWAWGYNEFGQLGDGTTNNSSVPVQVTIPDGSTIQAVSAGYTHSLALTTDGRVFAWGSNWNGQLGDGTTNNNSVPTQVTIPDGSTIQAVAAGSEYSLALTTDGRVFAWGGNYWGPLGDGTSNDSYFPKQIMFPVGTVIREISAGPYDVLAVTTDGRLFAWGINFAGQLGDGTTNVSYSPEEITIPGGAAVQSVSAGLSHSLATTTDGRVFAWGSNTSGELGDGTTNYSYVPKEVTIPGGAAIQSVSSGLSHSLAITGDGRVFAWGSNTSGELGDGTTSDSYTPKQITALGGLVVKAITAGDNCSFVIATDGKMFVWGDNELAR